METDITPEITVDGGAQDDPNQGILAELLKDEPVKLLKPGEIVEGPLVARSNAAVFVDLGAAGTGIIYGREFFIAQEFLKQKDIGEMVSAKVVDPENTDGYVELSLSAAYHEIAWEKLEKLYKEKATVTATIEAANRGGLMATVEGVKAFIPVSQLSQAHYPRVEGGDKEKILEALRAFVGQPFMVKVINAEQKNDKLILSERAVEEESLLEELRNFSIGDTVEGTVSGVVDFGLFLKFGPEEKLEGLVHVSEISWEPVDDLKELFAEGQKLTVKIIDIQGDKASLSLKALKPDPWQSLDEAFAEGAAVAGKPVRITSFGTFVEVAPGVMGIVRASEFADEKTMRETLELATSVPLTIASLNKAEHRMELKLAGEESKIQNPESSAEKADSGKEATESAMPQPESKENA